MEVEKLLSMASESLEQLRRCASDLQQMRVPHDLFRRYDAGKAAWAPGGFSLTSIVGWCLFVCPTPGQLGASD